MSNLVTNKIQVGQSPTPANNMVWEVDPATGILILRRGTLDVTGKQILKFNSDGGVNINVPTFKVYRTSGGTMGTSYQKFNLDGVTEDSHGWYNRDTANTVVVDGIAIPQVSYNPRIAGWYYFNHTATMTSPSNTELGAMVYKGQIGGAAAAEALWCMNTVSGRSTPVASGLLYMNGTTDYVQAWLYSAVAGCTVTTGSDVRSFFCGHLVRAA